MQLAGACNYDLLLRVICFVSADRSCLFTGSGSPGVFPRETGEGGGAQPHAVQPYAMASAAIVRGVAPE